jgi:hypothetical protein
LLIFGGGCGADGAGSSEGDPKWIWETVLDPSGETRRLVYLLTSIGVSSPAGVVSNVTFPAVLSGVGVIALDSFIGKSVEMGWNRGMYFSGFRSFCNKTDRGLYGLKWCALTS